LAITVYTRQKTNLAALFYSSWNYKREPFEKKTLDSENKALTEALKSLLAPRLKLTVPSIPLAEGKEFRVVNESKTKRVDREVKFIVEKL
jgi:hypothetical protein